jgi:hypothetical protein
MTYQKFTNNFIQNWFSVLYIFFRILLHFLLANYLTVEVAKEKNYKVFLVLIFFKYLFFMDNFKRFLLKFMQSFFLSFGKTTNLKVTL